MTIHREGTATIALVAFVVGILNLINFSYLFPISAFLAWAVFVILLAFFLFIVSFFRMPNRLLTNDASAIVSPADGKVVVIEETHDVEYFKDKRIQLSVLCVRQPPGARCRERPLIPPVTATGSQLAGFAVSD